VKRTEIAVGVVILVGIALLFFGTVWLKGARLGERETTVRARFLEIGQLLEGNEVKLRGVSIGRVEDIELEAGGGGVIVSMRVDEEVPLPADPVVLLSPESMFGDWQAEIYPRSRFPQYEYAEAPDPQVLPGYSLPDISRLTAVADEIAANLAELTERVGLAFTDETAVSIRRTIENVEEVSGQLTGLVSSQQEAVADVAANLEATSATINETVLAIRQVVGQVEGAVANGEVGTIVRNVTSATAQLDSLGATLLAVSRDLGHTAAAADTSFTRLNQIMAGVERGEGTIGRLMQDTALYTELVETNALMQALLADFQENPRKYINLEIF
jgi:phospholipid/cholesterol/gamma-HCH transport system substrate-binding protein